MTDKERSVAAGLPDPGTMIRAIRGSLHAGIFKAAVELDLFNLVDRGIDDAPGLAGAIAGSERIVGMLLDALCSFGLLAKRGDRYALTTFSRLFLVDSPDSLARSANYREVFAVQWQAFANIAQLARTGKPVIDPHNFGAEASYWESLVRYLIPFALAPAEAAAMVLGIGQDSRMKGAKILDIACGSGYLGYYLAKVDPTVKVVSNDWENVLAVCRDVAAKMGVADRVDYLPGDVMAIDLGADYDVVLVSRILTVMDTATKKSLLGRAFAALKPGGAVLINDPIADDAMAEATDQLAFALLIAGFHEVGGTYTLAEGKEWLAEAGFVDIEFHPVPAESSLISARKPRSVA